MTEPQLTEREEIMNLNTFEGLRQLCGQLWSAPSDILEAEEHYWPCNILFHCSNNA